MTLPACPMQPTRHRNRTPKITHNPTDPSEYARPPQQNADSLPECPMRHSRWHHGTPNRHTGKQASTLMRAPYYNTPIQTQPTTSATPRQAKAAASSRLSQARQHWPGGANDLPAPRALPSTQAADFGLSLAHDLKADGSQWALKPADIERLESACILMYARMEQSAPASTLNVDKSHWVWWTRWCDTWNTPTMRTDYKANMGHDWTGARREAFLQAAAMPWILARMTARGREFPLPTSALAVILGVRRIHKRLGYDSIPFRQVSMVLKALLHEYCEEHGPESLIPHRKSALPFPVVTGLLQLCSTDGLKLGKRTVLPDSILWVTLKALIATMAQSGLRKAEVSSKADFTRKGMSRANVSWLIAGVIVRSPTPQQLHDLKLGDYACVTPPPAKADQFGVIYGGLPIYLPYHPTTALCAARELKHLELLLPLSGQNRRITPLFTEDGFKPLRPSVLDTLLKHMLAELVPGEDVSNYSWHSFRITLACSLLKAGATGTQIQALCRWQTDQSLKLYARLASSDYAALLDKANGADITQVNLAQLPPLDEARLLVELGDQAAGHIDLDG